MCTCVHCTLAPLLDDLSAFTDHFTFSLSYPIGRKFCWAGGEKKLSERDKYLDIMIERLMSSEKGNKKQAG